jgi:hypothetical protein
MKMVDRIDQTKRDIEFISTAFHETDDVIHAALQVLVAYIGEQVAAMPAGRAAMAAKLKAEAETNAARKAAHLATGAPPLPEIKADINKAHQ